jgi:hypothetical protein
MLFVLPSICRLYVANVIAVIDLNRAYDGRKNFFTPNALNQSGAKSTEKGKVHEFTITVPEKDLRKGVPLEEQGQRFKVQIKYVADIDLESIAQFCAGKRQAVQNMESMLTAFMSVNVLLRSNLHHKYTASGAQERRFFSMEDAQPISNGAVVAKGFAQYVQLVIYLRGSSGLLITLYLLSIGHSVPQLDYPPFNLTPLTRRSLLLGLSSKSPRAFLVETREASEEVVEDLEVVEEAVTAEAEVLVVEGSEDLPLLLVTSSRFLSTIFRSSGRLSSGPSSRPLMPCPTKSGASFP